LEKGLLTAFCPWGSVMSDGVVKTLHILTIYSFGVHLSHMIRGSKAATASMVAMTTMQKYVAAGAACTEEKKPKLTRTESRAMTNISSIDHLPIKVINRNILVFRRNNFILHGRVDNKRMMRPTILQMGTTMDAVKMSSPMR
jgi:hypothetical protein